SGAVCIDSECSDSWYTDSGYWSEDSKSSESVERASVVSDSSNSSINLALVRLDHTAQLV
ncbi:14141_t:CDS:2, partial [Entrophospora sp. SA101]